MNKIEEIAHKISQVIEKANASFIYSCECSFITSIFSELRDRIPDFPSQSDDLDEILVEIDKLLSTLDTFKPDVWYKNVLETSIEKTVLDIKETMESLNESLLKIDIELTNKYSVTDNNVYDDLQSIHGKLADPEKKEEQKVKFKLTEIEEYLTKIEKPINSSQKSEYSSSDDEYDDVEKDDFNDVQKYKCQKSDYTQKEKPIVTTENYRIYEGQMKLSKEKVNIMVLDKDRYSEEKFKRIFNIITAVKHPNLISFVGAVESPKPYAIISQQYGEKLSDVLKRKCDEEVEDGQITIRPGYRTIIAYKIASAMAYLHSLKIINRDLCTSNILIDRELNPKISNFANSRFVPDNILTMSVRTSSSSSFKAPELNDLEGYDKEVDVFSFAGILYELLTNSSPFNGRKRNEIEKLIQSAKRPDLPESISPDLKELIESCWSQDCKKRPSFVNIVDEMLTKKIMFPQDENEEITKQFYFVKSIKNNYLHDCFIIFKDIQEKISQSFVYQEEAYRIRSILYGYQYALQESELAKQTELTSEKTIQIENLRDSLDRLSSVLTYTLLDKWKDIALSYPVLNIPNDIHQYMEEIYISLKSLGFKLTKYDYVTEDLAKDLRFIHEVIYQNANKIEKANDRLNEIEKYLDDKGLDITPNQTEINETLHEMLSNWKDFEVSRDDFDPIRHSNLGSGYTANVCKTKQISTKRDVAIKIIKSDFSCDLENLKLLRREIGTLVQLKHDYLTEFIGFNIEPGEPIWIVTEYIKNGDLSRFLRKISDDGFMKTKIAFEVAEGMEYLESKRIIHRDLKPANILISGTRDNYTPKICDFGFARVDSSLLMSNRIGTACYMAPEVIEGTVYNCKADVFSYGMILWQLYFGQAPFCNKTQDEVFEIITKGEHLNFSKKINDDLKDLIERCANVDPELRPTFSEIINIMINKQICFGCSNPLKANSLIKEFYKEKSMKRNGNK